RAQRRGAVEDTRGKTPVARIEPVANNARPGRELRRLADAEQEAGAEELAEALHESAEKLGERPKTEAARQKQARPELVDHGARGQLRERIGPQEGGQEVPHVRDRQMQIVSD